MDQWRTIRGTRFNGGKRTVGPIMEDGSLSRARDMIPPREILDYLVAELRVGARTPAEVLSDVRDSWTWDDISTGHLRRDIWEAHDDGRLTDAEASALSRGMDAWLASMADDDPTEAIDGPAIVAMHLTRESHGQPSVALRPGAILGDRYVLGDAVARGGQSIVFRAEVLPDDNGVDAGTVVAIKVPKALNPAPAAVARLKREFRQTQLLGHPGVVRMFDLGCDRGTWFIAMELLDGMSLRTRLNRSAAQPLGRADALRIVAACGAVLAHAHRHGFAHGDVKPGNLFLQENGDVKVLDFGSVHDIQPSPAVHGPEAGAVSAVTRTYASPELLDGLSAEPRDDIFSLACVAYEMLAGRHPFSRVPANQARARDMEVLPITGLAPRQNAALAEALAWSRERRPRSIDAWLEALLDEGRPVPARPSRPTQQSLSPADWLPWRWVGAVAAIAVLLFGVAWWATRSSDEPLLAPAIVADPQSDESTLQIESPAEPPLPDESSLEPATMPESAEWPTAVVDATPSARERAAPPVPAADPVRLEADTASIRIPEGATSAVVILRRSGPATGPLTVTWQLENGNALEGEDFATPADRTTRFATGQTSRAIYVPIVNDDRPEPEEFFTLSFQSPRAVIDSGRVTITILDDD
jgi:serine/threonine protein kinase